MSMILQKDLIAESGLKLTTARDVLRTLRKRGDITAEKDRFNHNQISYSTEDADKIRQEFSRVKDAKRNAEGELLPKKETKKETDPKKSKGSSPSAPKDTSVKDFVEQPGPEKATPNPQKPEQKQKETEEPKAKATPFYKTPLFYVAGGLLVLGLAWGLYQQYRKKQEAKSVTSQPPETPPSPTTAKAPLADQYRIM